MSSNHLDAPRDIVLTEARLKELGKFERTKREYQKTNTEYWEEGIYGKRSRGDDDQST